MCPCLVVIFRSANDTIVTVEKRYATPVKNWEPLLAEINPLVSSGQAKPSEASPPVVGGYGLVWGTRTKALVYHTEPVSEKTIPAAICVLDLVGGASSFCL